jgi:tRNA-dihydrouridine synthase B
VIAIGPHLLRNHVLLAPMAGVTDAPFRAVAWAAGAGCVASEMVSSEDRLWETPKSRLRRQWVSGIEPRVVQLAGSDPDQLAEAARRHWEAGAQVIDINFGCPAKKVCRRAAGSELLRDPPLVAALTAATVRAVPVPVTVKMRTGWSPDMTNGVEVAARLEDAGAAAIAVHGRTRACRFEGSAEYDTIAAIKARVHVPVIANGDIDSPEKARRVLAHTGADGVMIGRAALGAPWLLGQIAYPERPLPGYFERWTTMMDHVAALHAFYGATGTKVARKHVRWYLERMPLSEAPASVLTADIAGFNALVDPAAQLDLLADLRDRWLGLSRAA